MCVFVSFFFFVSVELQHLLLHFIASQKNDYDNNIEQCFCYISTGMSQNLY